ncbi:hypothetical protein [Deinococcus hohokamensis]|uniref:Uncharacterized protein n=1 Tax=Deinococcus hohokamensis TaxID=309883 RepID=A0ABV9I7A5_9DEIO
MRSSVVQALARDLQAGTRPSLLSAARRTYGLALVALGLPGLPLGGLYLLTGPAPLPLWALLAVAGLGAVLAVFALRLAAQAARDPLLSPARAALMAAIQAAAAPGTVFLLGCALLSDLRGLALLWTLALFLTWAGWQKLAGWVRDPQVASGQSSACSI